jgi:hypothetical protein
MDSAGRLENQAAATALNYLAYNFIWIHRKLRMSPAVAAGVTNRPWDVNDRGGRKERHEI